MISKVSVSSEGRTGYPNFSQSEKLPGKSEDGESQLSGRSAVDQAYCGGRRAVDQAYCGGRSSGLVAVCLLLCPSLPLSLFCPFWVSIPQMSLGGEQGILTVSWTNTDWGRWVGGWLGVCLGECGWVDG